MFKTAIEFSLIAQVTATKPEYPYMAYSTWKVQTFKGLLQGTACYKLSYAQMYIRCMSLLDPLGIINTSSIPYLLLLSKSICISRRTNSFNKLAGKKKDFIIQKYQPCSLVYHSLLFTHSEHN